MPEVQAQVRAVAVHGGAGNRIPRSAEARSIGQALEAAVAAAEEALDRGLGALDAVEAAVILLEDEPLFNAGRGSVPTSAGTIEMDAGVMCGSTLRAGAAALLSAARNPVSVARLVLEDGAHLLLAGAAADDFAAERGARLEPPEYFLSDRLAAADAVLPQDEEGLGTVGAVVCDGRGGLAAATSTGGTRRQRPGRIGDSPIVGAGVYAEDSSCAVSCTGDGEHIMRTVLAHRIACAVEAGASPGAACERAVRGPLADAGGRGGAIAVDAHGSVGMSFGTAVMHRAWKVGDGHVRMASE